MTFRHFRHDDADPSSLCSDRVVAIARRPRRRAGGRHTRRRHLRVRPRRSGTFASYRHDAGRSDEPVEQQRVGGARRRGRQPLDRHRRRRPEPVARRRRVHATRRVSNTTATQRPAEPGRLRHCCPTRSATSGSVPTTAWRACTPRPATCRTTTSATACRTTSSTPARNIASGAASCTSAASAASRYFRPEAIRTNAHPPQLALTRVQIMNRDIAAGRGPSNSAIATS